jgi:hypothetical protein
VSDRTEIFAIASEEDLATVVVQATPNHITSSKLAGIRLTTAITQLVAITALIPIRTDPITQRITSVNCLEDTNKYGSGSGILGLITRMATQRKVLVRQTDTGCAVVCSHGQFHFKVRDTAVGCQWPIGMHSLCDTIQLQAIAATAPSKEQRHSTLQTQSITQNHLRAVVTINIATGAGVVTVAMHTPTS